MANTRTKDNLFRSVRQTAATRAEMTTRASLEITRSETEIRDAKTAKLRKARLELEAGQTEAAPAKDDTKTAKP